MDCNRGRRRLRKRETLPADAATIPASARGAFHLPPACHPIGGSGTSPVRCPFCSSTATPRLSPPNWHRVPDTQCQNNPLPADTAPSPAIMRPEISTPELRPITPPRPQQTTYRDMSRHSTHDPAVSKSVNARPVRHFQSASVCQSTGNPVNRTNVGNLRAKPAITFSSDSRQACCDAAAIESCPSIQ